MDHLWKDPRTGIWVWRRVDPRGRKDKNGKPLRIKKTTRATRRDVARRKAAEFEEWWERERAGLPDLTKLILALDPLVTEWVEHLEHAEDGPCEARRKTKEKRVKRAMDVLGLHTTADLFDVAALDKKLTRHCEKAGISTSLKRTGWQDPLRQFSRWLAENQRYLKSDPLACWKLHKRSYASKRRAFLPDEVARALLAADALHVIHGRNHSLRVVFLMLLITAARSSALLSRDVEHLDLEAGRLDMGEDVGNKRRGVGALDSSTTEELKSYLGKRKTGPLLLSPRKGARLRVERLLDWWREAFGLGLLSALWPDDRDWDVNLAHQVNQVLIAGRHKLAKGGNYSHPKARKKKRECAMALEEASRPVLALADVLRDEWSQRMVGIDVHSFRMTHRTWAAAVGVPANLADIQLGHAARKRDDFELMKIVSGSAIGMRYYLDRGFEGLNVVRSAEGVRSLLDEAFERIAEAGGGLGARLVA